MTVPFVGREAELERIRLALDRAADEQPSVVLVAGEAGVGKTTLLEQARGVAEAAGFAVCLGAAVEGAGEMTYTAVRAALRSLPDVYGPDAILEVAGRHPAAEVVLPAGLQGTGRHERPDASATAHCTLELLGTLGDARPLLLALEDLHWADRATLELLSFLARNLGAERLLVIGTIRTDDLATSQVAAALAELGRLRSVQRIDLGGLDRAALGRLMADVLGRDPTSQELHDLERRSGGNPFYAVELLQARSARPGELPPSVRDILTLRLGRLPERTVEVIGALAALGTVADVPLLAEVLERPEADVERALRAGVETGVLSVDGATGDVGFRHALLRELAYGDLFASERSRLHAGIADRLATRRDADPAVLAHHHLRAGRSAEALETSLAAARGSAERFRTLDAVAHYRRIVELWDDVPDAEDRTGCRLVEVLGDATRCALAVAALEDGIVFASRLVDLLDPADDPEQWGVAAARLSELRWEAGDRDDAGELLARAAAHLPGEAPSEARVRVLERLSFHAATGGDAAAGAATAAEAVDCARALGDPELEALALNRQGLVHVALARHDGTPLLWESFRRAHAAGLREETTRTGVNLLMILHAGGTLPEALRAADEVRRAADELEVPPPHRVGIEAVYARILIAVGRWDEASDVLAGASESAYPRYRSYLAAARAELAVARGEGDDARAALADLTFSNIVLLRLHAAAIAAELALGEQRFHDVHEAADSVAPFATMVPETTVIRLCALALHAAPPDPDRYLAVAEESGAFLLGEGRSVPADAPAWLANARAAHAEAVGVPCAEQWREASAAFTATGFPTRAAWADAHLAAALVAEDGDRGEAARWAASAHSLATTLGARPLREHVEDLVRRARLEVPGIRRLAEGDLGLTEREAEVLRLVAAGRTNREIAAALFISAKTASVHVSNILRKVGATNRGEAAAVAHRHGLVEV